MRDKLLDFLKTIEHAIPPPKNCHHCLSYAQYGSDTEGWKDKLALQINVNGTFHCFFLDNADFETDVSVLILAIHISLSTESGKEQLGIAAGQYIKE